MPYIEEAMGSGHVGPDGPFTARCRAWLEDELGCTRAFLTTSCTSALEVAALVADVGPGDEVIMPSFTFMSTANAFALRGATPVFVDIRPDTLNIDVSALAAAITSRTRAIVPVHYGRCGLRNGRDLRFGRRPWAGGHRRRRLRAARPLPDPAAGSIGALAAFSFDATKSVTSGKGGALIVNDSALVERAEIVHDGGTDRGKLMRGEVDEYRWLELGSSCRLSELGAAYLSPSSRPPGI